MKYCPHCQQWNHGRPMRCRYCGRTWYVRLCPAGHVNPINANFCGECGRGNLSEPAGRRPPLIIRIIKSSKYIFYGFLIFLLFAILLDLLISGPTSQQISLLICIVMLAVVVNFVMRKANLSFRISGRTTYQAIVRFYRWVASLRIR